MKEVKYKGFIIEEVYGDRKIEDVFKEAYEVFYGVKVKVTRKTPEELALQKKAN
ncbi:hypothetical protein [Bacillus sp. UNC322MFChir4.1]|uniref:hypothetical protein n=1 Tax=Bacillus sp. UNC322MFChir4.1 TaxID=1449045 RepID=UPI000ADA4DDE|nr:hypothetical protein [Bacillus sp. UNC322MFChir4.1]